MKAVCWNGKKDVRVETVPDPEIINPRDAIIKTELTAICGSDLHLYNGYIPTMKSGDILGHEFLGEVVEVGSGVSNLQPGDRVVVPFPIACGNCYYCEHELFSLCDNSNPNGWMTENLYGQPSGGLFGYSHMLGGYAGGQAEYLSRFMSHIESVTAIDDHRSHWMSRVPAPFRLEWDATIVDEQENKKLSWRSLPGSSIDHTGSVFFHSVPRRNGTEVKVMLAYKPPAGSAGACRVHAI